MVRMHWTTGRHARNRGDRLPAELTGHLVEVAAVHQPLTDSVFSPVNKRHPK